MVKRLSVYEPPNFGEPGLHMNTGFKTIPFPQCALCGKEVEDFMIETDYMENDTIYKARCHGRSEIKRIGRHQLGLSDDALMRVLSTFFIEDAAVLGRSSRPPLSPLKKNYEYPEPERPRPDYVYPNRPKRMLDK